MALVVRACVYVFVCSAGVHLNQNDDDDDGGVDNTDAGDGNADDVERYGDNLLAFALLVRQHQPKVRR